MCYESPCVASHIPLADYSFSAKDESEAMGVGWWPLHSDLRNAEYGVDLERYLNDVAARVPAAAVNNDVGLDASPLPSALLANMCNVRAQEECCQVVGELVRSSVLVRAGRDSAVDREESETESKPDICAVWTDDFL